MDSETTPAADDEMRQLMRTLKRLYEHTQPYNSYPDAYWMEFVTRIRDGCTDPPDPTMFLAPLARPSGEDEEAMDDGAGGGASLPGPSPQKQQKRQAKMEKLAKKKADKKAAKNAATTTATTTASSSSKSSTRGP